MGNQASVKIADRREFFRHSFVKPLSAKMRIASINKKTIVSKDTLILIKDIGAGGLRIESELNFPVKDNVLFSFATELVTKEVHLQGVIKWHKRIVKNRNEYGVQFQFGSEQEQTELLALLNKVTTAKI